MIEARVNFEDQMAWWEKPRDKRHPTHPAVQAFAQPKVAIISKETGLDGHSKVLDIGCGNGFFTHYFHEITPNVVGLDLSWVMLGSNENRSLIRGRAERLPFEDRSFDLVFCSNLLHHVETPLEVVKEMVRVSKKYVVLSEPNARNPLMYAFSFVVPEERGALKFTPAFLESVAHNAGLRELYLSEHGSIVPNKTPKWALPFFRPFNKEVGRGFYTIFIGDRMDSLEY
ncbi:MAG: class I SAM-dependent methyltransferase [Candidatus Diapherotrites archaeon]|nr:class I SAM-dependent methyltransferase [Candidatus Diapherotrites archaeon]